MFSTIKKQKSDHVIIFLVFALMIFGLVMISSASAVNSYQNTKQVTGVGVTDYYVWRQLVYIGVSLIAWPIVQRINYRVWRKLSFPLMIVSIVLLSLVFVPGLGTASGTFSKSWISLGFTTLQPGEFAKLALILYLADFFTRKGAKIKNFKDGFVPFLLVVGIICGLLALQPDFGMVLIVGVIACCMYFVAGADPAHFLLGGSLGLFGMVIVVQNKIYILNRFIAFLNPDKIDPLRTGFHIRQALIAIGSGGWWGEGFGNSRQKFGYLPEAQGDSIFPVMAEELGFIRTLFIVMAFVVLTWRGFQIAQNAPDKYGKLVATGIVTWISFQTFINMAVNLSLFPTTGLTLPFVSSGGSSLLSLVIGVAILLNISRYSYESSSSGRRNWRTYYPRLGRSQRTTRRIGYRY